MQIFSHMGPQGILFQKDPKEKSDREHLLDMVARGLLNEYWPPSSKRDKQASTTKDILKEWFSSGASIQLWGCSGAYYNSKYNIHSLAFVFYKRTGTRTPVKAPPVQTRPHWSLDEITRGPQSGKRLLRIWFKPINNRKWSTYPRQKK